MKPTAENLLRSSQQPHLEPAHIYIEQPAFDFTELFLSDAEIDGLCAIPSRQAPAWAPAARWMPARQRSDFTPLRSARPLQAMMAAGMAWMSLPACVVQPQPTAPMAQVKIDAAPRAALRAEPVASSMMREAVRAAALVKSAAAHHARVPHPAVRPAPGIDEGALLQKAQQAMDKGQYKTALGMFKHVLHNHARQVDALFGAALASHELKDLRGADIFLKRALTVQPGHPLANVLAGFTEQLGHRFGPARDHYARFLSAEGQGERANEIRSVVASLPQLATHTAASR